jgi:polysaccharide pyruvyl transferase WcaK-like protein
MEYVRTIANTRNIHITKTLSETLAYIPKMDMILAMRLHGSILAFAYHVPFITLSYGYKTAEFCKSIDYPYILDTKNIDIKELTDMISVVISQADTLRTDIAREHIQVQQHIHTKLLVHNI